MLSFERDVVRTMICSDSQAVLMAMTARTSGPAQSIIDEALAQIERNWVASRHPAYRLEITWVKGHNGVEGNKKADAEAKLAAKGRTSWRCNLPAFLTEFDLPQSIAARRQAYNEVLDKTWGQEWVASPWFARLHQIDPTMPSNRFRKVTLELNR